MTRRKEAGGGGGGDQCRVFTTEGVVKKNGFMCSGDDRIVPISLQILFAF